MIFQGKKFILAVFATLMVFLSSATAFATEPVTSVGYAKRAMEYYNNKQYDLAIADYKKAIEMDDKNASLHMDLGALYAEKKDWEKARKHFTAAIELEHKAEAYAWRAITYLNQGRWPETVRNCEWALERDPMCADAHFIWGQYCIAAGRLGCYEGDWVAAAIRHYSDAIRVNPNYIPAYKRRAEEYMTKGNYDGALADCQKVMEHEPDNQQVKALMSKIQEKTAPPVEEKAPISLENGAGYPSAAGGTGSGRIEFIPRGHEKDERPSSVAIWKTRPSPYHHKEYNISFVLYFERDERTPSREYHEGVLRACFPDTYFFDVVGYDDEGKPNTFLINAGGEDTDVYGYVCRLTVLDHDNVKIEWLNTCENEWERKRHNPSYPEPAPVVREPSRECSHPVEIYTFRNITGSELNFLRQMNSVIKRESGFMSEYGIYPGYLEVHDNDKISFEHSFGGSTYWNGCLGEGGYDAFDYVADALIAFWENGGEVELYPEGSGSVATGLG